VPTKAEILQENDRFLDALMGGGGQVKVANDAINDFTRLRVREGGVQRAILPPITLQDSDLDRQVDSALPAKIVDMEPDSPAAANIGYRRFPDMRYIFAKRYRVLSSRIVSSWFQVDVEELRTHNMDVRQIMSDNSLKDIQTAEDDALFAAWNQILVGPDQVHPISGVKQWRRANGGVSRNTVGEMQKVLLSTPGRLKATQAVINANTAIEFTKLTRNEVGGDWSEDLFKNGWTSEKLPGGIKAVVTIKFDLVPDGAVFLAADPKFLGKFFEYTPPTMYVKREGFLLSYFTYETIGGAIANPYAVGRYDFQV